MASARQRKTSSGEFDLAAAGDPGSVLAYIRGGVTCPNFEPENETIEPLVSLFLQPPALHILTAARDPMS